MIDIVKIMKKKWFNKKKFLISYLDILYVAKDKFIASYTSCPV